MDKKIGTHNSATGEQGKGLLSWLLTPFARTQRKDILMQYASGCRSFDIRVKREKDGNWTCAHGLWKTKRGALSILEEINAFSEPCQVQLTYEGTIGCGFTAFSYQCRAMFTNIIWGNSCIKYGKDSKGLKVAYEKIAPAEDAYIQVVEDFLGLNGRRWQSFLPVPRLWHRFYKRKHEFNDKYFVHVDFL